MGVPPTVEYASLGMADSLILMVLALVVFGPRRLPQIGRQIGKLMYEFRKASNDFKYQMEEELRNAEEADRRKKEEERLRTATGDAPKELPAETTAVYSNPAESPAAYETVPASDPHQAIEPAAPSAELETAAHAESPETSPRLQPPSTGETVAAERPGNVTANGAGEQMAAGTTSTEPAYYFSAEKEAVKPGSQEATEQATHNG